MRFFGDAIKKAEIEGEQESKRGPSSILGLLPEEFNYQQVEALRVENKMNANGTMKMLNNWLFRGYIKVKKNDSDTQLLKYSVFIKTH